MKAWHLLFFAPFFVSFRAWAMDPSELEEPGYSFLVGNPYTEQKHFAQFALSNWFLDSHSMEGRPKNFNNALQINFGFSDRLEGNLTVQYDMEWMSAGQQRSFLHGFDDTILGLRYRFLTEKENPITLAFGPQLWLPTGNFQKGFGLGSLSLAWDLTIGKEWNKWFFQSFEVNYATTFSAPAMNLASSDLVTLHSLFYGIALGFRPLEIDNSKGGHHDVHLTLEFGGSFGQQGHSRTTSRFTENATTYLLVPGIKYGYSTKNNTLTEVGLGGILGLNSNSPDWGLVLQTQWEFGI